MSRAGPLARSLAAYFALGCLALAGCAGSATPGGPQATPSSNVPEILTLGEAQPYRERLADGLGGITWESAYTGPTPEAVEQGRDALQSAFSASAGELAVVDYVALALPDWVTVTQQLKVAPGDFTGQRADALEVGTVDGQPRFVLYEWRGPEIPQRPDRRVVYRWVYVYGLYDIAEAKVTRLLATIHGEAHE